MKQYITSGYLDFSKAFDTLSPSHRILLEKLAAYGLTGTLFTEQKNCLESQAWRMMVNGITPAGDWSLAVFPRLGVGASPDKYLYESPGKGD